MTCASLINLLLKQFFVVFLVFPDTKSDVGDVDRTFFGPQPTGYIYPQHPVHYEEEPTHIYLPLLPPILADETPTFPAPYPPPDNYLPPSSFPVYFPVPPSNNEVFSPVPLPSPPSSDDTVIVPAMHPQIAAVYPPSQALSPPQFKIENMSCIQGLNFRATFKMASDLSLFPVADDSTEGCITSLNGNMFKIDLGNFNSMLKCGVRRCKSNNVPQVRSGTNNIGSSNREGENMCVVLRMPTVRGVKLPEDPMVTLVCTPQERVVSRTKHVRLGTNKIFQNSKGRSANGFIAIGGTQKDLKSRISIFRKRTGTNIFDQNVQPESVIQLGEELVLRAVINDGDGWQSSQIGPVLITGLKSKKSALLVNQNGCVNPVMRSICPQQPIKISPLSTELHFRAFLFQESPQGDEMVISVRTQGCLNSQDCIRSDLCRDDPSTTRSKRELNISTSTSSETKIPYLNDFSKEVKNWESQLWFRVAPPSLKNKKSKPTYSKEQEELYLFVMSLSGLLFLSIGIVAILLVWQLNTNKIKNNGNY